MAPLYTTLSAGTRGMVLAATTFSTPEIFFRGRLGANNKHFWQYIHQWLVGGNIYHSSFGDPLGKGAAIEADDTGCLFFVFSWEPAL